MIKSLLGLANNNPITTVITEQADGSITSKVQQVVPTVVTTPLQTGVESGMTTESYTATDPVVISSIDNPTPIVANNLTDNPYNNQAATDAVSSLNDSVNAIAPSSEYYNNTNEAAMNAVNDAINADVLNQSKKDIATAYEKVDAIKALEAQMGLPTTISVGSLFDNKKPNSVVDVEKEREALRKNNYGFSLKQDTKVRLFAPRGKEDSVYGYADKFNNILTILHSTQGIVFPYTPTITESQSAEYAQTQLVSSNQDYYAYKTTGSTKINVTGDFILETQYDGEYMLAVIHFMRVITKSHFGKRDTAKAGLPPPILHLSAYGKYMYDHLPVILASRNITFDHDIDYINVTDGQGFVTKVPKKFSLSLELIVQNTPRRMREEFNLDEFRTGQLMRDSKGWI
jgi:hypothetical protein